MPEEWGRRVRHWATLNRKHKIDIEEGLVAPDPNEEYLLYQTLVGAWPVEGSNKSFVGRIQEYMNKALHEAKVNTSWINPSPEYDAAVGEFVARILDPEKSKEFLEDLAAFSGIIGHFGTYNSLAQTLLRCTAPGAPDTYQGTELWDFSLVDPDNRRPVDYEERARMLKELTEQATGDRAALARTLIEHKEDGRVKLFVVTQALQVRRQHPELFAQGAYEPIDAIGSRKDQVFAFARIRGDEAALVVVPRLVVELAASHARVPLDAELWQNTHLALPETLAGRRWIDAFTNATISSESGSLALRDLFSALPLVLLASPKP